MAMAMAGGGASGPQMNVTPLMAVLLVLIIIFMVIVAKSKPHHKGLEAQIPQPAGKNDSPSPERTIVIQLGEANGQDRPQVRINQQPVTWPELRVRLRHIFKPRTESVAFVQGDDGVNFEYVADVIATAREGRRPASSGWDSCQRKWLPFTDAMAPMAAGRLLLHRSRRYNWRTSPFRASPGVASGRVRKTGTR